MRKKNILVLVEHILWGIIILLPLLGYLVLPLGYSIGGGSETNPSMPSFTAYVTTFGVNTGSGNVIFTMMDNLMGRNGVLPLFNNSSTAYGLMYYFTYFICVEVVHLVVDVILFIPRLAHKWMSKFTNEEVIDNG